MPEDSKQSLDPSDLLVAQLAGKVDGITNEMRLMRYVFLAQIAVQLATIGLVVIFLGGRMKVGADGLSVGVASTGDDPPAALVPIEEEAPEPAAAPEDMPGSELEWEPKPLEEVPH